MDYYDHWNSQSEEKALIHSFIWFTVGFDHLVHCHIKRRS